MNTPFYYSKRYHARATGNVMQPGMNYLQDLILRPGIEKMMWPILLYRGNMNPGHAHRLWNFALLMMAAEAETLADGLRLAHNPAFAQLCGPVRKPQKYTLKNFFGRLWEADDVTRLIPGLKEYVKLLDLGPCGLTPIDLETARANCAPWRISTHENPGQEPKERGAKQLFYPFACHDPETSNGHDLTLFVNSVVGEMLPPDIRADVCQDMIVAILTGSISRDQAHDYAAKYTGKAFGKLGWRYEGGLVKLSTDAPVRNDQDDDRTIGDMIHDGSYRHWSEEFSDSETWGR